MNSLSNNERFYIPNTLDGIDLLTENIESNALLVDGSNFMTADLDAGGNNVKNMANATALDEAVNLAQLNLKADTSYVDSQNNLKVSKAGDTMTGSLIMNTNTPIYLNNNPSVGDGASLLYATNFNECILAVNAGTSDRGFDLRVSTGNPLSSSTRIWVQPDGKVGINTRSPAEIFDVSGNSKIRGYLDMSLNKITNVANPTNAQDAATKNYVDVSLNLLKAYVDTQDTADRAYTDSSLNLLRAYVDTQDAANRAYVDASFNLKVNKSGDSMTGKLTINQNATTFTNFDVTSTQTIDIKSGNPLYDRYTLTYTGLGSQIRIPYNTQADTTLQNKTIAFKITGGTQIFLQPLPLTGAFTTIIVDGVSYVSTSYTISSSIILKGTGTVGHYTTSPYQEYMNEDQLTVASNLGTDANDEYAGIRFVGTGTEVGFIRVDTNRTKSDANMTFYVRQANTITTPLVINNSINSSVPYLINGVNIASIGYNQTWQNPSRAKSTWYNNTTGRPIQVMVSFSGNNDSNQSRFVLEVSTSASPSGIYICAAYTALDTNEFFLSGIIPASNQTWYKVEKASGGNTAWNVITWSELR